MSLLTDILHIKNINDEAGIQVIKSVILTEEGLNVVWDYFKALYHPYPNVDGDVTNPKFFGRIAGIDFYRP